MMDKTKYVLVAWTVADKEEGKVMIKKLLNRRYIACAHLCPPVKSFFRWNDRLEEAEEYRIVAKTLFIHYPVVERLIQEQHSYDVPEILCLPIVQGLSEYFSWVDRETR